MKSLVWRHKEMAQWLGLASLVAMLIVVGVFSVPAQAAKFSQQGNKLVGIDVVGNARQGGSVALSADGNTAIVGGWVDDSSTGAAWVYVRVDGLWMQQGNKLVGGGAVGAARQGYSVALSADGNTAVVGGLNDDSEAGAAWVFVRDANGVWSQQGNKLVGSGALGAARQGISVALSADGNTAIVGGDGDGGDIGAAWVFTRSGGVWTQQGNKLVGNGVVGVAFQGASVALSADGNTAIVGGPKDDNFMGAVWVFSRSGGAWTQQGNKLVGSGVVGVATQGNSVALSADGDSAIVGGANDNSGAGAAWAFTRSGGVWAQQGNKLVGSGNVGNALQGRSVALSADGNTAIVGGSGDNGGIGAAWLFARNKVGVWKQQGNKLVGSGAVGAARQGFSAALSADGNTAIVGGDEDNGVAGAGWVFGRPGITQIDPIVGTVGGRTRVAIVGTNLLNVTGVTFGGVAATDVTPIDAETVLATTPSHAAGKVNVGVSTQTSGNTLLRRGYTYEPYPTATFLFSSANPSTVGQTVRFTAAVSGGGIPASGKVTFKDGTQTLGTVNLTNGVAKLSTAALAAGRHTIIALFRRNGMFAASKARLRQRVKN